jgi:HK97 gp10 family phage protein
MAEIVTVKITGLDQLQDKLNRLPAEASRKALKKGLRPAGLVLKNEIQTQARKLTGWMAKQVFTRIKTNNLDEGQVKVSLSRKQNPARIGKEKHVPGAINEALWNEFGTSKMAARPFIRPAFESKKEAAVDAFVRALRETLEEVFR